MANANAAQRTRFLVAGAQGRTADVEFVGVADLLGLSDGDIVGKVWRPRGAPNTAELTVEILDAEERIVRIHWGDAGGWLASQTRQDAWNLELHASWPDTPAPVISPERRAVVLKVRATAPAVVVAP